MEQRGHRKNSCAGASDRSLVRLHRHQNVHARQRLCGRSHSSRAVQRQLPPTRVYRRRAIDQSIGTERSAMSSLHRQRGATLFIGLVMLVILTLFALSAFQTSSTNLKTVGNMQSREEAQNAAQQVIDTVISSATFVTSPTAAIIAKCGVDNVACVDFKSGGGIVTDPA